MYHTVNDNGLGFSLKPPAWLRQGVATLFKGATQAKDAVNAVSSATNPPGVPAGDATPTPYPSEMPGWVVPAAIGLGLVLFMRGRKG